MSEVRCEICGATEESNDSACEKGWTPYFFTDDQVEHDSVCSTCAETFLQPDSNGSGEMILKPGLNLETLRQNQS